MVRMTVLLALSIASVAHAAEPFKAAKSGQGECSIVSGIPVIVLRGTPEEVGRQYAELVAPAGKILIAELDEILAGMGWTKLFPTMKTLGSFLYSRFPADHRVELEAIAKASKIDPKLLIFATTVPDLMKIGGCSTLVVEANRSATGNLLFGRNLDWPPVGSLPKLTAVVVTHIKGKHAVASVTYPLILGCFSGMNDAGLCLTMNEITATADDSTRFDPAGTPQALLYRKILEECSTVAEAERMLRAAKRTTWASLTIADAKTAVILEITPKTVVGRAMEKGVCCCTNHFREAGLTRTKECERYSTLVKNFARDEKFSVAEMARQMDLVSQGDATVQTMVFEPATRTIYLAAGKDAAKRKLVKLELAEALRK